ncbi:MAG: prepilin peptidase [Vampirovibrio sp.]|nr:prepilin peptidase [Vampirovibrio sp.]
MLTVPSHLTPLMIGLGFVLGAIVGSFLNVVGLRFLNDQSIVMPSSRCPNCHRPLTAFENIPILSYLLLRGQCLHCKDPISMQYPLVEMATGLLFAFTFWSFGLSLQTLFLLFLISNLMVITITDFRESLIFQVNSLPLIPAGLIYSALNLAGRGGDGIPIDMGIVAFTIPDAFISALLGVFLALIFFEGLILLSEAVFGTEGFGHGDTHLMMGAGAFLGWELTVVALLLGFIVQSVPAIPMLMIQWIQKKDYLSLGSITGGVVFGILPMFITLWGLPNPVTIGLVLASIVLSLVCLVVFLRQTRQSQSFTYMPLGPSLIVGILVAIFWGQEVLGFLTQTLFTTPAA